MKQKVNFPLVVALIILSGVLLLVVAFQYDFSFQLNEKPQEQNYAQERDEAMNLCNSIIESSKEECYASVGRYTGDESICNLIEDSQWYLNDCYQGIREKMNWSDFSIPPLVEWKTYQNEEYGFEFKYPSNIMIIDRGKLKYYLDEKDIFSISFPDLQSSISVIPNSNIFCGNSSQKIGNNIIASTHVFDKMCAINIYYEILTNRDYGFVIDENHSTCPHYLSTEKKVEIMEKITESFNLIEDVISIDCRK